MSQEAYDIVIVGAGAAGCVVASYLAEHTGASIALIEAGDLDRDPFIHIPAGFAKMLAHISGTTRRFPSTAPSEPIPRARCSAAAPRSMRCATSVVRDATMRGGRRRSGT